MVAKKFSPMSYDTTVQNDWSEKSHVGCMSLYASLHNRTVQKYVHWILSLPLPLLAIAAVSTRTIDRVKVKSKIPACPYSHHVGRVLVCITEQFQNMCTEWDHCHSQNIRSSFGSAIASCCWHYFLLLIIRSVNQKYRSIITSHLTSKLWFV